MAKLSVNALIGPCTRSKDVFYSMRTSDHEVDGRGQQVFFDDQGRCHYDHVYATELFSNHSMKPAHDFVMASEHVELARHRALREVPPRYLVAVKTDCLVFRRSSNCAGLNWVGWAQLKGIGLESIGLGWAGLGWAAVWTGEMILVGLGGWAAGLGRARPSWAQLSGAGLN